MQKIQIDDDVFGYLQKKAIAYVETPSDTIRRLLHLAPTDEASPSAEADIDSQSIRVGVRQKKRKVDLTTLIEKGLIRQGEKLFLHDSQNHRISGAEATIAPTGRLERQGKQYSMSKLAVILLNQHGHSVTAARGPAHWHTQDGQSMLALWQRRQ